MTEKINDYLDFVFKWEGKWSNDPHDEGGKTHWGIIESELPKWYPNTRIEDLTKEQAVYIYKNGYWKKTSISKLPDYLHLYMFDTGINMGIDRAERILQKCISKQSEERDFRPLVIDGVIGPKTLAALKICKPNLLFCELVEERARLYRSFRTFWRHGAGWLNRLDDLVAFYYKNRYL